MDRHEFFDRIFEYTEGTIEIRVFKDGEPKERKLITPDSHMTMDAIVNRFDADHDIYYGIATRSGGGMKEHIQHIPAVWCDVDHGDMDKLENSLAPLELPPSIIVFSGRGFHLYWLFNEAYEQDEMAQVEKVNRGLCDVLGGDTNACDASRILRPPETTNQKRGKKVSVLKFNNRRYDLSDFEFYVSNDIMVNHGEKRWSYGENMVKTMVKTMVNPEGMVNHGENMVNSGMLNEGSRDNEIFHLMNCLCKGGYEEQKAIEVARIVGNNCTPPFSEPEAIKKVASAYKRPEVKEQNLTTMVKTWLQNGDSGIFMARDLMQECNISKSSSKYIYNILYRLCGEGVIEKCGNKRGQYRKLNSRVEWLDYKNIQVEYFSMGWFFNLEQLVTIMPKNLVVIAGDSNSGKTALMLNLIRMNQNRGQNVYYFSSEMSPVELHSRLSKFDISMSEWSFQFAERSADYADAIQPDGINLIDFIELSDNFYQLGGVLTDIFNKLTTGIAICAVQKKPGESIGRGGAFGLEKPRLYLSVSNTEDGNHTMQIVKAKSWADPEINPNYKKCKFKIRNGCYLVPITGWE